MLKVPFTRSYWVVPNSFLAGEHPAAENSRSTGKRLRALIQSGITVFIDLTEDTSLRYDGLLEQEAIKNNLQVEYWNFPIEDFTAPGVETVKAILDTIDNTIAAHKRVYVHCYGGIGRTGTIVGCYFVRHGMDGPAALAEIASLRKRIAPWGRSPEADDQIERVLTWQNHQ